MFFENLKVRRLRVGGLRERFIILKALSNLTLNTQATNRKFASYL